MKNTHKPIRFRYAATLFGALAIVAVAPATAYAEPNGPTGGGGGCHYTDRTAMTSRSTRARA
ncbi:hypothetical protein [Mycobacterium sp. HNNTM2301]|uniref:hypothetical protein n=1 Tax=Mycobacterium hainanense TaxID=3289775 RepID=UPI0035A57A55